MPHRASRLSMALAPALILGGLVFGVSGCTQFPEVNASVSDEMANKPYPDLVPIHTLRRASTALASPRKTPTPSPPAPMPSDPVPPRSSGAKRSMPRPAPGWSAELGRKGVKAALRP